MAAMKKEYLVLCRQTCIHCKGTGVFVCPDSSSTICPECQGKSYKETLIPLKEALDALKKGGEQNGDDKAATEV